MTYYSYTPDHVLSEDGSGFAAPVTFASSWCFVSPDNPGEINFDVMRSAISRYTVRWPAAVDPYVPVIFDDIPAFENTFNIVRALQFWKAIEPLRPLGVYRYLPKRDYLNPTRFATAMAGQNMANVFRDGSRLRAWQKENSRRASQILPFVDFVCPSLYPIKTYPTADLGGWLEYAMWNVQEAIRVASGRDRIYWLKPYNKMKDAPLLSDDEISMMFNVVQFFDKEANFGLWQFPSDWTPDRIAWQRWKSAIPEGPRYGSNIPFMELNW